MPLAVAAWGSGNREHFDFPTTTMTSTAQWQVEDIDVALAADFEGSLSGLGMELGTSSFNMSDALLALPNLSSLKQECIKDNGSPTKMVDGFRTLQEIFGDITRQKGPSPPPMYTTIDEQHDTSQSSDSRTLGEDAPRPMAVVLGKKNRLSHGVDDDVSSAIKRFCVSSDREAVDSIQTARCRHSNSAPDLRTTTTTSQGSPTSSLSPSVLSQMLQLSSPSPPTLFLAEGSPQITLSRFQYVLGAATSIATKMHEERMTYLNQGQSYEIKLKKLGDLTEMRGKKLKSTIRVGFQERRLQYMEKEQIALWQHQRVGERILDIDIPLSYGIYDVVQDPHNINICEFLWDPTKETGVFVRVNCISTEFTPKKHGGEKGVPFRIYIETFSHGESPPQRLHAASCQVKVFKPKGADRKHKTDREKMAKRPQSEQEKYQPSYDCTEFTECTISSLYPPSPPPPPPPTTASTTVTITATSTTPTTTYSPQSSNSDVRVTYQPADQTPSTPASSTGESQEIPEALIQGPTTTNSLSSEATATETTQWLQQHRFGGFVRTFSNFSGADILRLSRDDLIQICGLADGIRLYNALHSRTIRPRLTLYMCCTSEQQQHGSASRSGPIFRAVYLENLSVMELTLKMASIFGVPVNNIQDVFVYGPSAIKILVTDEVVQNMSDETMFIVDFNRDHASDLYIVLMRRYVQH